MKKGLNLGQLYKFGANSIVECIKNDCDFYNIEIADNESIMLSGVIIYNENSMLIDFEVWDGNEWKNAEIPYPFYKKENEELFLDVMEEVESISELKDFIEYN